jgi:hypothetical protein
MLSTVHRESDGPDSADAILAGLKWLQVLFYQPHGNSSENDFCGVNVVFTGISMLLQMDVIFSQHFITCLKLRRPSLFRDTYHQRHDNDARDGND